MIRLVVLSFPIAILAFACSSSSANESGNGGGGSGGSKKDGAPGGGGGGAGGSGNAASGGTGGAAGTGGSGGTAGAAGAGGAAGADAGGATGCALFSDAFEGSAVNTAEWGVYAAFGDTSVISQTGGVLRISPLADKTESSNFSGIFRLTSDDLSECIVAVEVVTVMSASTGSVKLVVSFDSTFATPFEVSAGSLLVGGVKTVAYSPTDHRFWRVTSKGGMTHFETAPTKTGSWADLYSFATPPGFKTASFQLVAGTSASAPVPGIAEFDNVAVGPAP